MNTTLLQQVLDSDLPDSAKLQVVGLQLRKLDLSEQLDTLARILAVVRLGKGHHIDDENTGLRVSADPALVASVMAAGPVFGIRSLGATGDGSVSDFVITLSSNATNSGQPPPVNS